MSALEINLIGNSNLKGFLEVKTVRIIKKKTNTIRLNHYFYIANVVKLHLVKSYRMIGV